MAKVKKTALEQKMELWLTNAELGRTVEKLESQLASATADRQDSDRKVMEADEALNRTKRELAEERERWIQEREALIAEKAKSISLEQQLAEERARLDWLEANPRLIVASTGYRGAKDSWCWRDVTDILATHEASTLRDAIDAARKQGA
jgi:predicted Zn-dependent peptidase